MLTGAVAVVALTLAMSVAQAHDETNADSGVEPEGWAARRGTNGAGKMASTAMPLPTERP